MSRLAARVHLEPMRAEDVGAYLRHRMNIAGLNQEVFSEGALLGIREATGCVTRKVDLLAQQCLDITPKGKGALIDGSVVHEAIRHCADGLR